MTKKNERIHEQWVQAGFFWGMLTGILTMLFYLPEQIIRLRQNVLQRSDELRQQLDGSALDESIERGKALARAQTNQVD